ncbi:MAG: hypothetical protein QGG40_06415, partial [Myxococcota bacterium]|nr:hypothetical protein [Myxococcota bacterium]
AEKVIEQHRLQEANTIFEAFREIGIDWKPGESPQDLQLQVAVKLSDGETLMAGASQQVVIEVTNTGDAVYQLSAVTRSGNNWLDRREFYFGALKSGETRSFGQRVTLQDGYGTEIAPLYIQFRTPDNPQAFEHTALIRTQGKELPRFAYTTRIIDDGTGKSRGNGDGRADVGEIVDLEVSVTNLGKGPSGEAFVRVKNRSGRALDLTDGGMFLGEPTEEGLDCDDPDTCPRVLEPGDTFAARVTFELRSEPEDGAWKLDLMVGDNRAYDYTTITRAGFYDYFLLEETLEMKPGQPLDDHLRQPPLIEVTRSPEIQIDTPHSVVSGLVSDDRAVRDVIVFHGSMSQATGTPLLEQDKIFYQGGDASTRSLPFTAERSLEPGTNLFIILARDLDGLTATRTIGTWYEQPRTEAAGAGSERPG